MIQKTKNVLAGGEVCLLKAFADGGHDLLEHELLASEIRLAPEDNFVVMFQKCFQIHLIKIILRA